jgi:predicted transcriptional regulator
MPTPVTSIRIDPKLKRQATIKARRLHLPLSTVISHALEDFLKRDDTVTLGISPAEWQAIEQAAKDADEGKNIAFTAHNKEELHRYLDSLKTTA